MDNKGLKNFLVQKKIERRSRYNEVIRPPGSNVFWCDYGKSYTGINNRNLK